MFNNNIEKDNNQNLQSIDDIKRIFNNDYPRSNNFNNLYGNNNVKDLRPNNIFKNEFISGDNMSNNKQKGPYKLEYNNNINDMMNKKKEYDYGAPSGNGNNKKGDNNNFNLNPNHMHKINAIISLLEDLNLENLIHVKNQIMKMVNQ